MLKGSLLCIHMYDHNDVPEQLAMSLVKRPSTQRAQRAVSHSSPCTRATCYFYIRCVNFDGHFSAQNTEKVKKRVESTPTNPARDQH